MIITHYAAGVAVALKCLSSFWKSLDLPWIKYKLEPYLSCLGDCIIHEISKNPANAAISAVSPPTPAGQTALEIVPQ